MPLAYLLDANLADDFWTVQSVSSPDPTPVPPSPQPTPTPTPTPDPTPVPTPTPDPTPTPTPTPTPDDGPLMAFLRALYAWLAAWFKSSN